MIFSAFFYVTLSGYGRAKFAKKKLIKKWEMLCLFSKPHFPFIFNKLKITRHKALTQNNLTTLEVHAKLP